MLIRFIVKNLFSFKEQTEFNLLPSKATRLKKHKYSIKEIEILKLSAIYGANGSGKSNFIKSISLLKQLIVNGAIPHSINNQKFKLSKSSLSDSVDLGIEFFCNNAIYFYSVSINGGVIIDEYFSESGNENKDDLLIFHRTIRDEKASIVFFKGFEEQKENELLKKVIETDLIKPNQPLFSLLNSISNNAFIDIKVAYEWIANGLTIIYPNTKASGLAIELDSKSTFRDFANELICSFNTGISNIKVDVKTIEEFLGEKNQKQIDEIRNELTTNKDHNFALVTNAASGEEIAVINDDGNILAKRLLFDHKGEKEENFEFSFTEESDGTRRLLEYIPVLKYLIDKKQTFIIDEIERSIHPLIIKELVSKFSKDDTTNGQLIFSTHESNLLDQEIFRTDEIWFAEKSNTGASRLYSLSDFKEHNTIDIRKGYLNGRYGAIPFLSNLEDLNWNKYTDADEK